MPGTVFREPILIGDNDDLHKVMELVSANVNVTFNATGLSASALSSATGTFPGCKPGMLFFFGPANAGAVNATSSAVQIVRAECLTAGTINLSAANFTTGTFTPGTATFPFLGVRTS